MHWIPFPSASFLQMGGFGETGHRIEGFAFGRTTAFEMEFPRSLHIARKMWMRHVYRLIESESEIHGKDQTTKGCK